MGRVSRSDYPGMGSVTRGYLRTSGLPVSFKMSVKIVFIVTWLTACVYCFLSVSGLCLTSYNIRSAGL